jgi:hypothetical protein
LLKTLGFVLKVGTCHYTGDFFFRNKKGIEMCCFPPFCFHDTKCPGVFLRLATMAESVSTDFKIINVCTSMKDKHYFLKIGCQGDEMSK